MYIDKDNEYRKNQNMQRCSLIPSATTIVEKCLVTFFVVLTRHAGNSTHQLKFKYTVTVTVYYMYILYMYTVYYIIIINTD